MGHFALVRRFTVGQQQEMRTQVRLFPTFEAAAADVMNHGTPSGMDTRALTIHRVTRSGDADRLGRYTYDRATDGWRS